MWKSVLATALALSASPLFAQTQASSQQEPSYAEPYVVKDYSHLVGNLTGGFTAPAVQRHLTLYAGYVKNTNLLMKILRELAQEGKQNTPCFAEIKRRLGWEWDGMRLHEYYFDNLGGSGKPDENSELHKMILDQYGTFGAWQKDYKAVGAMRGIGWVILYQDPYTGKLINTWIQEHPDGHLAGSTPLLVMDVWEHAYMWDFLLNRKKYIDAFFENVDWQVVQDRYAVANDPSRPKLVPLESQPARQSSPQSAEPRGSS